MQNSRNAREAELPAELPQVPLMLPNRRHGHQSSPSCLQKIDRASPEQPRHAANGRMAAATAPETWRLARYVRDCGSTDLGIRPQEPPRPAEPPQLHSMLPDSPAQPPRIPILPANSREQPRAAPTCSQTAGQPQLLPPSPGDWRGMCVIVVQLLWHAPRPWRTESATICTPAFQRYGPGRGTHPAILPLPQVPTPKLTQSPSSHNTASWPLRRPACDCTPPDVGLSLGSIPAKPPHAST